VGHKAKRLAGESGNEAQVLVVVLRDVAQAKLGLRHREPAARRIAPKTGQAKVSAAAALTAALSSAIVFKLGGHQY
jgi:hypothetical protein